MKLTFPNSETLQVAITGGFVPQAACGAAVAFSRQRSRVVVWPDDNALEVDRRHLGALQVEIDSASVPADETGLQRATCWPQILPLQDDRSWAASEDLGTVLFEVSDSQSFANLVSEILRLGNDRMSFRCLTDGDSQRFLLQVVDPPYYALLGAIDPELQAGLVAYREHASGVWIRFGYRHPLASLLQVPAGTTCLIRSDREWIIVSDGPFRDVNGLFDFVLANQPIVWKPSEYAEQIQVPVRLTAATSDDTPTLWVLRENAFEQLDQLVATSDDELLSHLSFALAEHEGRTVGIVRVRPGATEIPVLVVDGVRCRSYLKIPDFYLPCGYGLHPPLRRSTVSGLFLRQKRHVTWLYPLENGEFTTESMPDSAFQSFQQWVDYVLERGRSDLQAWIAANQFEFESFVADEREFVDRPPSGKRPLAKPVPRPAKPKKAKGKPPGKSRKGPTQPAQPTAAPMSPPISEPAAESAAQRREQTRAQVRELEGAFRESDEPLNAESRLATWRKLAPLYEQLGDYQDATICWSNLLWGDDPPEYELARGWREAERRANSRYQSSKRDNDTGVPTDQDQEWLNVAKLAATLVLASSGEPTPEFRAALPKYSLHLESHEANLPVKAAWLAWLAIAKLSGNDVLALARARDRFLRRLYDHGLRAELNMPSFARAAGPADAERLRLIRSRMPEMQESVKGWIVGEASHAGTRPKTKTYADLIFAYGYARIGEVQRARDILAAIESDEQSLDDIHRCLIAAYRARIEQTIVGNRNDAEIDTRLLDQLESLDRQARYVVDRLRSHSAILEPQSAVPTFAAWLGDGSDSSGRFRRQMVDLFDIADRDQLRDQIVKLVRRTETETELAEHRASALVAALDRSQLLDSRFAGELLDRVMPILDSKLQLVERAQLMERGILVAGHYGNLELVEQLCAAYEQAMPELLAEYIDNGFTAARPLDTTEDSFIFVDLFPVLRRLKMGDRLGRLFAIATDQIAARRSKSGKVSENARIRSTKLSLHVAAGWIYLGREDDAEEILAASRSLLFHGGLNVGKRVVLSEQYANVLAELSPTHSMDGLQELFRRNANGDRLFDIVDDDYATTSSHFGLQQLRVVEAAVLGAIGYEFSLNSETHRWLDEEEFLIRRRIHRDVRKLE